LRAGKFVLPDIPQTEERDMLEEMKASFLTDCKKYVKDAERIRKKINDRINKDE